jgi:hypothetical protein
MDNVNNLNFFYFHTYREVTVQLLLYITGTAVQYDTGFSTVVLPEPNPVHTGTVLIMIFND